MSLYSRLDRIAADVEKLNRQVNSVANAPQSQRTSVEGGSIDFNDADGNLKAIIGMQDDGGYTTNVISGPTPPTPANFTVEVDHGKIVVHWDGTFENALVAPTDWARAEVYAQEGQFVTPSRELARGSMVAASGGEVTIGVLKGEWTVCMAGWSQAGIMSPMSAPVTVDVPGYGDIVLTEIDAAETVIKNAGEVLVTEQGTLDEKLTEVDGTLNDLGQDLQAVEDAQAQLNTDLTDVMTSVDGKNTITWNPSAPSAVSNPGKAVGDMWYRTSGNNIIGFWKWDGTDWVTQLLDKTTIPLIDIGAGTFGNLAGTRLAAKSVTADQLLVGGVNLMPNPRFFNNGAGWSHANIGAVVVPSGGYDSGAFVRVQAVSGQQLFWHGALSQTYRTMVDPAETYRVSVWVRSVDSPIPAGGAAITMRAYTEGAGQGGYVFPSPASFYNPTEIPANTWARFDGALTVPGGRSYVAVGLAKQPSHGVFSMDFASPSFMKLYGATLIEDGGITTPKLAADVLEVKNLKATSGQLDEAVINKLFSDVVVAKTAVANAFIGENAILTGAVTAPKITASEELWAKIAEFVKIRAEHIEADAIDGMVITGPNIRTSASGARVQMDPNGVRVFNADNDVRTHLSPDGSTFKGEVEAETLVVNDGAEFKGNNTLAQGAKLTLAAGVTDPTAPPTVQPFWDGLEFTPPALGNGSLVGLAFDGTNYWTTAGSWYEIAPPNNQIFRVNGSTGAVTGFQFPVSGSNERFGVTCIGSELFWLYRKGYQAFVVVTDLNCVKKREWEYPNLGYSSTNPLTYKPGIGNDGTNIVTAQCTDAGRATWRVWNKTTGAQISYTEEGNDNAKTDFTGVHIGAADWGGTFVSLAKKKSGQVVTFNTSGVYDGAKTFSAASPNSTGVVYADGKWRTLDPSGVIHEYADNNTGDNASDWWAGYGWWTDVDSDGTAETSDYQSRMSPPTQFTWPRRAGIKIMGQPMPTGAGFLMPWLAKKTAGPVRTDFHGTAWNYDTGKPIARISALPPNWSNTISPPAVNTFPEATSSVVESASGTFQVKGDGSGHWGPLTMGRNGVMSGLIVTGDVTVNVTTANTPREYTINLPAGRFSQPPVVWVQVSTSDPLQAQAAVIRENITTSNFKLWFNRSSTTGTGVTWYAMDRSS